MSFLPIDVLFSPKINCSSLLTKLDTKEALLFAVSFYKTHNTLRLGICSQDTRENKVQKVSVCKMATSYIPLFYTIYWKGD